MTWFEQEICGLKKKYLKNKKNKKKNGSILEKVKEKNLKRIENNKRR